MCEKLHNVNNKEQLFKKRFQPLLDGVGISHFKSSAHFQLVSMTAVVKFLEARVNWQYIFAKKFKYLFNLIFQFVFLR